MQHPICMVSCMEMAAAIELFKVVFQDVSNSDAPTVTAALRASRRLRSALEAREGELHLRLESLSSYPEKLIADTTKTSVRNAERKMKRATTAAQIPVLGTALALGKITGEHVDAYARAANELSMSERAVLALQSPRLALVGEHGSFEEFTHELKKAAVTAREDDGTERLKRQRRSTKLTTWTDRNDGMFCMHGRFDPVTGLRIAQQLADALEAQFTQNVPADCPTEPGAKQDFLRAHALLHLLDGHGTRAGRPEFIAVIDERTPGPDGEPIVDFGYPVDVPRSVVDEMRARAQNYRIVVRDNTVVSADGVLNLGRTSRLANRAQRRALRALYSTCAIPGCGVRYDFTKIHHIIWWEHHGLTDLNNLLPVCERHHHKIHDAGWQLSMRGNRQLTVRFPDGTTMHTGPPLRHAA